MIVPTMSYPEIYRVLENAAPKLRYKKEQLRPKAVKYFTREVWNFPAFKTYEYTIPATNDTYIIYFYAEDENAAENPASGCFCFLRHWNPWQVMITREMNPEMECMSLVRKNLLVYTTHFFDRYRERKLKNPELPIMEAICKFFARNKLMFNPCDADNRLWAAMADEEKQERIEGRCAIQILDGLILAQGWERREPGATKNEWPEMVVFKALTFISRDMYYDDQSDSSAEQMVKLGKRFINIMDDFPVKPDDFEEIVHRNRIRKQIQDLEDTL
jgi:hypothetical protein